MATGRKKLVIIAGPTAVGKTSLAIEVAKHLQTEIISADSRQCYKELKIGVARPSDKELEEVRHHFIASHSIHEKITAANFEQYALQKANEIFQHNDKAVMVGGTGLYIKAFCEGMDQIPEVPESLRNEIASQYQLKGLEWLRGEVEQFDPAFFAVGEIKNPHRLMRALEVAKATGQSILHFRRGKKAERNFDAIKIALHLPKEKLHSNIEHRVDQMMQEGLLEEVRSLIPFQHLKALQTVGYKELFAFFNGETEMGDAVSLIKRNTRQYAKRQLTWFKKDSSFKWIEPALDEVMNYIKEEMV